jgi:hypothetical protein
MGFNPLLNDKIWLIQKKSIRQFYIKFNYTLNGKIVRFFLQSIEFFLIKSQFLEFLEMQL